MERNRETLDLVINRNGMFDTMVQNLGNPNLQENRIRHSLE